MFSVFVGIVASWLLRVCVWEKYNCHVVFMLEDSLFYDMKVEVITNSVES